MNPAMRSFKGKALTVCGPVDPEALGRVLMHEHLHSDPFNETATRVITEEQPTRPERRKLLMREAVPFIGRMNDYGCHAYVDATPPPMRAWPDVYVEASRKANMHIILCTGFYREIELGKYWAKTPSDQIWPFVRQSPVEALAEFCIREIQEGIHGTQVHAGVIKLGTSQPVMTEAEQKAFRAGARAQQATGVHITTHCTVRGAETSQLQILDDEGVDLNRVVIGHTAGHLMDRECRKTCIAWMKRGANFMPTNLGIREQDPAGERWRPLMEAIHDVFEAGLGDHLVFGTDCAFCREYPDHKFGLAIMPPPPYTSFFIHTLPAFRKMGLTPKEEEVMLVRNPRRIIPVQ